MRFLHAFCILFFFLLFLISASGQRGLQWNKNGDSYFVIEGNGVVEYQLPSFQKSIVVDSSKLVPKGSNNALRIRSFSLNENRDNMLIYTNTKRVWRQDTRGDYWVFNIKNNSLKQLGKSRPPSSLMFAKISPDGKKAAYVSDHNIYVEDLGNGTITQITKDGTLRIINGTFDWAYEEEFDCRDGFRWSPDSRSIAYWQIDARKIKNFFADQ